MTENLGAHNCLTFPPLPVCWPRLNPEQHANRLTELAAWLAWLKTRYVLDHRTLPNCWHEHGALIEELSALATGWTTAFSNTTDGYTPLHWHTDFDLTRRRLTDWNARQGCRPDQHRPDSLPGTDSEPDP